MELKTTERIREGNVPYIYYPLLEDTGIVRHGVSTRLGGVSTGYFSTMNLSFTRGDRPEDVRENYRRIGDAIGVSPERMVCSQQTHTTNIRIATEADTGKGVLRERDYTDVDGLVTNVPGLCLVTYFADCVPILLVDPVRRAIGSCHSGWKGTVGQISRVTLETMRQTYGTDPEDVLAVVGPSICQQCYEVSEDVIIQFRRVFQETHWNSLFYRKDNGKYQLDLWKANEIILRESGISPEHLVVTDLCTCCNPDLLFSHRATGGKRGNLAVFLALKE